MTTPVAIPEMETLKRARGVGELERLLGTEFDVWVRSEEVWECLGAFHGQTYTDFLVSDRLETLWKSQQPSVEEIESGQCLVVIPKKDLSQRIAYALTCVVETDSPGVLLFAIEQSDLVNQHEEELERLREENTAFLRQVSEDFEELTFLRSMAEHLTLEDSNQGLTRLTDYTLSLLGQIVGVEHLYFLDSREGQPRVQAAWSETARDIPAFEAWQLEALTQDLSEVMGERPLVRNSIHVEDLGHRLQGIKELVIVPVSSTIAQLGWLLAINRSGRQAALCTEVSWKLSQHELGTREASLLCTAAAMLASHANNLSLLEERENLLVSVVRTLVSAVDSRDPYTCGHSERVALYAKRLAEEIGLADEECEKIYLTGLLHDLGKIGISDSVLKKCGPLSGEEFAEIQRHPDLGWAILQELEQFAYVLPGVLHHHERYDGKGYPDNLPGEETPLAGRLLAVVDSFDAMTSDRPYRAGMPLEKALEILGDGAGTQWDAQLVDKFLRILPDILEIRGSYRRPPLPTRKLAESES
ncbi:MAG: HD-GYP domain-containing protein [Bythopirellula sp.]|nr:HD-GYP domain-containing protein [Bythopirellula sp.]